MSIDQQLKDEFQQNNKNIECPPSIDLRVMNAYREQVVKKKGEQPLKKRRKWSNAAIIVLLIAVVSGFAYAGRTLLFEEQKGNLTMSAIAAEDFKISTSQLERLTQAQNEVKAQLEPGESAVFYLTDLDSMKNLRVFPVLQPKLNENLDSWRTKVRDRQFNISPPDSLLETYKFAGGTEQHPFGQLEGTEEDIDALYKEMKAESKKTGKDLVWKKTTNPSSFTLLNYTSVYRNSDQNSLYLVQMRSDSKIKLEMVTPTSTQYEAIELNGHSAHYFKNDSYIYTDSHFYQEVSWMVEEEGQTFINTLGSDSPAITKEQLIEAASNL